MITSFYTSALGVSQIQKGMDIVSNNIANAATSGYKPMRSTFSDLLYTNVNGNQNAQIGHGMRLDTTDSISQSGAPIETQRRLDFALFDKNTYFAIETPNGVKYTRDGSFHASAENGTYYLSSANGYVLDQNGQRIEVDINAVTDGTQIPPVGVYRFENAGALVRDNDNLLLPTDFSGAAVAVENPNIASGYLEGSAVNMAEEMSNVIQYQRAFQFNSRIVQISDEIMQTINSMR